MFRECKSRALQRPIFLTARNAVSIVLYVFTLGCFLASGLASSDLKGETDKMRRLALVIALSCTLSGAARAGEIHSTGVVASPQPSTLPIAGEIHTTGAVIAGEIPSTGATVPQPSSTLLTIILTFINIGR